MKLYTHQKYPSMLPSSERGVDSIMRSINGAVHRRPVSPGIGDFWRPPADVRAAIARGDRKVRHGMAS